jgi:hypothetical protein
MATAKSQGDTPDALNAVTMTVTQMDGETKPAGSPFAEAPAPAAKAKAEPVDAVDEPV